jgi:hypothetical protein
MSLPNDHPLEAASGRVPTQAAWLGAAGLIPFLALAALTTVGDATLAPLASDALRAYGATILSFLGGMHWGFALRAETPAPRLARSLSIGVAPQLIGWLALLTPERIGFALLAVSIVGFLWADREAVNAAAAPSWFMRLRAPLSLAAGACLTLAALL